MPTADDREAIRETIHRYAHHFDFAEFDAWVTVFTEDVEFAVPSMGITRQGRADMRRIPEGLRLHDGLPLTRHQISNTRITFHGNEADAVSYFCALSVDVSPPRFQAVGRYVDRLRRVGGTWLIARRTILFDYNGPL